MGGATLGAHVTGPLGIFGGTFDPIHIAHLAVAQEAADVLGLERVAFVPAGVPPHKPGHVITPGEHRLAMVELAIAGQRSVHERPASSSTGRVRRTRSTRSRRCVPRPRPTRRRTSS